MEKILKGILAILAVGAGAVGAAIIESDVKKYKGMGLNEEEIEYPQLASSTSEITLETVSNDLRHFYLGITKKEGGKTEIIGPFESEDAAKNVFQAHRSKLSSAVLMKPSWLRKDLM